MKPKKVVRAWGVFNTWNGLFISAYYCKRYAKEFIGGDTLNRQIRMVRIMPIRKPKK